MKNQKQPYLELDRLEPNFQLARRLPPDLAYRIHALPIAKDGEQITVAMANPKDDKARETVLKLLGEATCIVQANENTIDRLLTTLWPEYLNPQSNFLAWLSPDSAGAVAGTYAQVLSALLGVHLHICRSQKARREMQQALQTILEQIRADLVILQPTSQSLVERLLNGSIENLATGRLTVSSLLFYGYRWPIKKILLVLRNDPSDEAALNWTLNIARQSQAVVNALIVTAPVPHIYARYQPDISTWMTTDCSLGQRMSWVAHRLVDWEIEGILRLRNEQPSDQIRCEVLESEPDLIVIAAEPRLRINRWPLGDLIHPTLQWIDRPLLISRPRHDPKVEK